MAKKRKNSEAGGFENIMTAAMSSFERPKPLARGVYKGTILPPRKGRSPAKKTPFRQFLFAPSEEIKIVGEQAPDWSERRMGMDKLYISKRAMWAVREFFEQLGLNVEQTLPELIQEAIGLEIYAAVDIEETDDGDHYNVITDFSVEPIENDE